MLTFGMCVCVSMQIVVHLLVPKLCASVLERYSMQITKLCMHRKCKITAIKVTSIKYVINCD